jgi:hypothetical protein
MKKIVKGAFNKPTEEEVFQFINGFMVAWPERFARHMAQKFHNFYTANGWKISGRAAMKDFEACFKAQWKDLKYREDKLLLEQCLMEPMHRMRMAREQKEKDGLFADATVGSAKPVTFYLEFYETLRQKFLSGLLTTPWKELAPHYDRLKAIGIMRLPKHQTDQILVDMGNNRDIGKGMAVMRLFLNLQEKQLTVSLYYDQLTKKMQEQQP